ncbi:MAG: LacI family transcriptional regulator [Lachnospiraceae bacterium]|jgi:LacI family transcriptional regulator|nr:LacI family transcriptional regulator [Lachnospiraceae bacterium]
MGKRITIHDVALAAQVSNGTVHRALNGKKGVSDAVRKKIIRIAREMGYEPNIVASSLKKKPLRIVVAFPGPTQENRFFYGELWNGYRNFYRELTTYNMEIIEAPYYNDEINSFSNNLKTLMRQYQGEIHGVISGGKLLEKDILTVKKLIANEVAVVLVSEGQENLECLCSVQSEHWLDGQMAAELLTMQIPSESSILLCAGDVCLFSNLRNAQGFESFIKNHGGRHRIIKIGGMETNDVMYERVLDVLKNDASIRGMYSVSARHSLAIARAADACGLGGKVRIIGSDLYPESAAYMEKGVIQFIIDKNPRKQAEVGVKRLMDYLIRREEPAKSSEYVASTIVCRSNLHKYMDTRDCFFQD